VEINESALLVNISFSDASSSGFHWFTSKIELVYLVLAMVAGYPAAVLVGTDPEAPAWVRNCQATRTGSLAPGCYPDRTETRGFLAGLEPDRSSNFAVPSNLAPIEYLSSDRIVT